MKWLFFIFIFACNLPHLIMAQTVYFPLYGITVAGSSHGTSGNTPDLLNSPIGIFLDDTGNLYIADQANDRIQKWIPGTGTGITVAGGNGFGSSSKQLFSPSSVFVDDSGYIFIADKVNNRIQKWHEGVDSGITVAGGHGSGTAANQISPNTVWVNKTGAMYIYDSYRIQKWLPGSDSGITVAGGHGNGNALNQLYGGDMYVDTSHTMYICDAMNHRVLKWKEGDSTGTVVAGGNGLGTANNQFDNPQGITLDNNGNMYISDGAHNARIFKWALGADSGTVIAGSTYGNLSQLNEPYSIKLFQDTILYVADAGNNRILKFQGHYANLGVPEVQLQVHNTSVYPSPSQGNLTVTGEINTDDKMIPIAVVNSSGQQVFDTRFMVSNKKFSISFQLQQLPNGIYHLFINGNHYISSFIIHQN